MYSFHPLLPNFLLPGSRRHRRSRHSCSHQVQQTKQLLGGHRVLTWPEHGCNGSLAKPEKSFNSSFLKCCQQWRFPFSFFILSCSVAICQIDFISNSSLLQKVTLIFPSRFSPVEDGKFLACPLEKYFLDSSAFGLVHLLSVAFYSFLVLTAKC